MKTDTYRVFEMDVTKEEKATINEFCRFLEDAMDYIDNFELMYYMVRAIAHNENVLEGTTEYKINVNIKEGEN